MARELVPLLAVLLDWRLGDPPNRWHPVAWQGRLLGAAGEYVPEGDAARLAYGTVAVLAGAGISAAAAALLDRLASR
ncbi:MAG TPA: cobalamin biosynthesis protein, partial [Anaerolineae bacterium]